MNYYLRVTPPNKVKKEELEELFKASELTRRRPLSDEEKYQMEENINLDSRRLSTLEQLELLVMNFSPKMKELKSQLDFQLLRTKFLSFDYAKYNYFEFDDKDYEFLKRLLTHDNYFVKRDGVEVALKDIGPTLSGFFTAPNTKPEDYEK